MNEIDINCPNRAWVAATLIKVAGDIVHLKRQDNGNEIEVPLAKLSQADQRILRDAE